MSEKKYRVSYYTEVKHVLLDYEDMINFCLYYNKFGNINLVKSITPYWRICRDGDPNWDKYYVEYYTDYHYNCFFHEEAANQAYRIATTPRPAYYLVTFEELEQEEFPILDDILLEDDEEAEAL